MLGGAAVIAVLALAAMSETVTMFVWKNLWGPIVADAAEHPVTFNGVTAQKGYNIYNTVLYAAGLGLAVLGLDRLLDRWEVGENTGFVVGLFPLVVFGGLLRVVEDTGVVPFPFNTLIITPIIYFVVFLVGLGLLKAALHRARRTDRDHTDVLLRMSTVSLIVPVVLLLPAFYDRLLQGVAPPEGILPVIGISAVAVAAGVGLQTYVAQFVPGSFLDSTVGRLAVVAQVTDGAVTATSLSFLGYGEKHVLSDAITQAAGTPYAFLLVKAAFIIGLLAVIDYEEDRFSMLVMLGVIAVGLGPATRNLTRAVLGI